MSIVIPLVTEFDQRGIRLAEKRFKDFQDSAGKVGQSIKAAFIPAAAAVAGLGVAALGAAKAAMEDQQSAALLERQLQATTKATQAQVKATEAFVTSLSMATGEADDNLRPALAKIVRSTKDLTKSQKLLGIAVDVARGSGKSLSQVADALSRAYGGNVKALARLDPSLKQFIDKTTTADEAVAMLAKNFDGAAAKNAETFAGRMDILRVTMAETYESIGYALLPIIERFIQFINQRVVPAVQKFVDVLEREGLAGAIKMARDEFGKFITESDGWTGQIISITGAVIALSVAIKGLLLFKTISGAATALSGVLTALGSAVLPGLAVSAGAVAGVFASVFATIVAFIDLMKDATARSAFLEYVANTAKLIANGFILAYNAAVRLANLPIQGFNLLPGVNASTIPLMDLYDFTFDTSTSGQQSTAFGNMRDSAQIQINVNGALNPVETGKQIRDILNRTDRRGISGFGR
jgi:hypothetical protein